MKVPNDVVQFYVVFQFEKTSLLMFAGPHVANFVPFRQTEVRCLRHNGSVLDLTTGKKFTFAAVETAVYQMLDEISSIKTIQMPFDQSFWFMFWGTYDQ